MVSRSKPLGANETQAISWVILGRDALNLKRKPQEAILFPLQVEKENRALTAPGSHSQANEASEKGQTVDSREKK